MCDNARIMRFWNALVFPVLVASCSTSPANPEGGGAASPDGGAGAGGDPGGASAGGGAGAGSEGGGDCTFVPDPVGECASTWTKDSEPSLDTGLVSGRVVDPQGSPMSGVAIQVCGTDNCLYGESASDGTFSVQGGSLLKPLLKWGDGRNTAKRGLRITEPDPFVGDVVTDVLPAGAGIFAAGATLTVGDVTAIVADDLDGFAFNIVENGECSSENQFRAVALPTDESDALEFGLAPLFTTLCPGLTFKVANTKSWPAEAEVTWELFSFEVEEAFAPYGEWMPFATGKVSSDGEFIEVDSGAMVVVGNLRIRRTP